MHSYGVSPGSGVRQLNYALHLDGDNYDNVLVCDCDKNRVELSSHTLTYLGDMVIPGHQLYRPFTLHFDDVNHRLYIGEWKVGNVCA